MSAPKLRFGEFDSEWKNITLGSLSKLVTSGSRDWAQHYSEVGSKFIRMTNLSRDRIDLLLDDMKYVDVSSNSSDGRRTSLIPGDILMSITAELGKIGLIPDGFGEAYINQHTALIRLNEGVNPRFIAQLLGTKRQNKKINKLNDAGAKAGLNLPTIKSLEIAIPEPGEQQKIASFLSAIVQKIFLLTKNHELLLQYKKGVIQKIFNQEIKFRDKGGKCFPGWKSMSLAELGDTYNGLTGKTADDFGFGADYITYKQIFDSSRIDASKFGCVSIKPGERQNVARYGDLFFTTSSETPNEVGYCSVLLEDVKNLYLNSFCFGYRIKSFEVLSPKFARFMFFSSNVRESIVLLAQGSTRYNISKTNFMKIKVLVPALKEQEKISLFLESLEGKLATVASQIELTKKYKQGLLQQMFI